MKILSIVPRVSSAGKQYLSVLAVCFSLFISLSVHADPPFNGTIFIDRDIITAEDPTSFVSAEYTGRGNRSMFDRRSASFVTVNAYLFHMTFSDGLTSEAQVNPEFGSVASAREQVLRHARAIGQIPTRLRRDVDKIWIHDGKQLYGGGNRSILIHVDQTTTYENSGILEETLVHEAAHTSLDADYSRVSGWTTAQNQDGEFISTYARDNPTREDVAESFLPYLALRYRQERISDSLAATISTTIPNRIAFFDAQNFNMFPVTNPPGSPSAEISSPMPNSRLSGPAVTFEWNRPPGASDFDVIVGTSGPGSNELRQSSVFNATEIRLSNLPTDGSTIYFRLWTYNEGWDFIDYQFTAAIVNQDRAALQNPQTGTVLDVSSVNFSWSAPSGARAYDLIVGTGAPGADNLRASRVVTGNNLSVSGIPQNGQLVYVRLWTFINSWKYHDYIFATDNQNARAQLLSPQPGASFKSASATFTWSKPIGVSYFDLYIGTQGPGSSNIRAPGVVRGTSLRVDGLPSDGQKIYLRFWSYENGWKYNDYVYN